jgi:hypothetical protein
MSQKEVDLLKEQIKQLSNRKFDLEAWKAHTLVFVSRIFGENSEHVRLIRELKYDYSSWNLRDTAGGIQASDPVRNQAREILDAAVSELETLGVPKRIAKKEQELPDIFRNELTGREVSELERLLALPANERKKALTDFIGSKDKEILTSILVEFLLGN